MLRNSLVCCLALFTMACSGFGDADDPPSSTVSAGGMPPVTGGSGGAILTPTGGGGGTGGGAEPYVLPDGFTAAEKGGWMLGADITNQPEGSGSAPDVCGNEILAIVRDFRRGDPGHDGHPDFQVFYGDFATTGLVNPALVSQKPAYSGTGHLGVPPQKQMTSEAEFVHWYNSDPAGVENRTYELHLSLEPNAGVRTFQSSAFFPLDGAGFGEEPPFVVNEGLPNEDRFDPQNFHFTTEVHTRFAYRGGEIFSFAGDDDLWVFVNGRLALDLGGLHPSQSESIDLDARSAELGIAVGGEYSLELFHAERGMPESNFRIDTTLEFTQCGIVVY